MAMYRSYSQISIPRTSSVSSVNAMVAAASGGWSSSRSSSGSRHGLGRSSSVASIFPLGRSTSQVFSSVRITRPGPHHQRTPYTSTPYYSETYPHVRHSHGYLADSSAVKFISSLPGYFRSHYSSNRGETYLARRSGSVGTGYTGATTYSSRRGIDSGVSFHRSTYASSVSERPKFPVRDYVGSMGVDDAIGLYSKRYMTVGNLSKYFLSGGSNTRRDAWSGSSGGYGSSSIGNWRSRYLHYSPASTATSSGYRSSYGSYGSSRRYWVYHCSIERREFKCFNNFVKT